MRTIIICIAATTRLRYGKREHASAAGRLTEMMGESGIDKAATDGAATTPIGGDPGKPTHRRIASAELMSGAREIEIDHRGELYRLRCTSNGKLILTK